MDKKIGMINISNINKIKKKKIIIFLYTKFLQTSIIAK